LIAPVQDSTKAYSGISLAETAASLAQEIESGDWASVAMGAVGTALDALSAAMDPFGAILAAGVGWLLEHVGPLKEALTALTGNADQIAANSETWKNIATELSSVGDDLNSMVLADTTSWVGDAGDAYRKRSADTVALLQAAAKGCEGASRGVKTAGEVVGAVRMLVRDTIAQLVGHLISWALQVLFTLGIGLLWVVPEVISAVAKTASEIANVTGRLVKAIKALIPLLKEAGTLFGDAASALKKIKRGDGVPKANHGGLPSDAKPMELPSGKGSTTPSGAGDSPPPPPPKTVTPPPPKDSGSTTSSGDHVGADAPPPPKTDTPAPPKATVEPDGLGSGGRSVDESVPVGQRCAGGDPVDLVTGEMFLPQQDLLLPGVLALVFERVHLSGYRKGRWFGRSWASTLDQRVAIDAEGIHYAAPDGVVLHYRIPSEPDESVLPANGAPWPLKWDRDSDTILIGQPETGRTLAFPPWPTSVRPLQLVGDRHGNRITFGYDQRGVPTDVHHSGGYHVVIGSIDTGAGARIADLRLSGAEPDEYITVVSFGYDTSGRLVNVFDAQGRPMVFEYVDDRIVGWTDRIGHAYRYGFDREDRVAYTDGTGGFLAATFEYDRDARTTTLTDSLGNVSEYHWNELNQVVKIVDPVGAVTLTEYDRHGRALANTDPLGRSFRVVHDNQSERVRVQRPDGSVLDMASDHPLGYPTRQVAPDNSVWQRTYDKAGNLLSETNPAGATTTFEYGERGQLRAVTDALGRTARYQTDTAGLLTAVTDLSGATTRIERDAFGRVVAVTDALGAIVRTGWTVEGRKAWQVYPDGAREEWRYDAEGNLAEHRAPNEAVTTFEYGPFDEITVRTDPSGDRYTFAYDTELRLITVTNPQGLAWRYGYDAAGNVVTETDFNGSTLSYSYDKAGQLTERINGAGQRITFVRDALGRVIRRHADHVVYELTYDSAGRVSSGRSPGTLIEYTYDALGRVLTESLNGRRMSYRYDLLGRVITRTTPSGAVSRWTYDDNGRSLRLIAAGGDLMFHRDVLGREIARDLGPGVVLQQGFDRVGQLTRQAIRSRSGSAPEQADQTRPQAFQQRTFAYRADGHLVHTTDQLRGPRSYDLDLTGRVTAVHAADWTERYVYDAQGNLAHVSAPGDDDTQGDRVHAGTLVERAGRTVYEHDVQGRMVRRVSHSASEQVREWTYSWDADDRLVRVTTPKGAVWEYVYDAFGRRTAKRQLTADGAVVYEIWFAWDGTRLAEQGASTGDGRTDVVTWDWEPGTHRVLAQTKRQWTVRGGQHPIHTSFHAIVTDLVGTPTELVNSEGRIAWDATTNLWGVPVVAPREEAGFPLRFPGQYHDAETGLNYNFQRYYNPSTAAYLSPDPLGLNPAPNNHAYVDNPLVLVDPLGLAPGCGGGGSISDSIMRTKRIWGRKLNGKTTPDSVYRWDDRPPHVIAQEGFAPHNPDGSISIQEHVTGSLSDGKRAKYESQYVSTADYSMVKDPVLLQTSAARPGANLYRIDTSKVPGGFTDVNDYFDQRGLARPYPTQREWAHDGAIPPDAVTGYVPSKGLVQGIVLDPKDPTKIHSIPDPQGLPWKEVSASGEGPSTAR
jgi:RHS repeat-associated protein